MRYVAAYLLAALGGKENPNGGDIKKILESVGIEADETRMQKVSRGKGTCGLKSRGFQGSCDE